ncbi:MAG: hypothetical protein M1327_04345 [Candidatus Thermoplasmatota archaeon]|nr:hypothetical protein [Candidatus Thermoplasmatota archaeon]
MTSWSISMNLYHTGLSELYREIEALGDPLTGISNHDMGYILEELIRKFNEANNEEAGEHFTPRGFNRAMCILVT